MVHNKSLDPYTQIIAALLCDVQTLHSEVFTKRDVRLTTEKVVKRVSREGIGFLTKTLPRLGKALDRALSGEVPLDSLTLGFAAKPQSKLPRFLGELFQCVFSHDGWILPTPCVDCIKSLRQLLFVFYKLELPYDSVQESKVINQFVKTEDDLDAWRVELDNMFNSIIANPAEKITRDGYDLGRVIRKARSLLSDLFSFFDPLDIHPKHGPGAVSTRERLSEKYTWSVISPRILQTYPLDAFFFASNGHVCDELIGDNTIQFGESSARVILVPKDSRGPRLISCEPLDFQWIQQGLGRAIVQLVESHPLTRWNINFTNQQPNRFGALLGSKTGGYATLDLKEASDRVSVSLVRLLFPAHLTDVLMNCRSQMTELPGGGKLLLNKFAPMGSALCFPIMAITIWALLTAGLPDAVCDPDRRSRRKTVSDIRESILVYGDDVIVPTAQAANAIRILESFGLLINRDKSCVGGFFRESCGMDAYLGIDVTPVRLRTVWTHHPSPGVYTSYIAFCNAMFHRRMYCTYDLVTQGLFDTYREIPEASMNLSCPSLISVPEAHRPKKKRVNRNLQKLQYHVFDVKSPHVRQETGGWQKLLRFFAENSDQTPLDREVVDLADAGNRGITAPFSVSQYTKRKTSCLVKRWR